MDTKILEIEQIKYTKLCKSPLPWSGAVQRLMINDDHLLIVIKKSTNEEYRRFLLKEICQLTVYKTWWGMFTNIIASLILAFFLLMTVVFQSFNFNWGVYGFATCTILTLLFLLVNILRGPAGKVLLTTLNTEDSIVFAHHFYKTLKVLRKIRPMIEKAQAGVTREETIAKLAGNSGQ